MGRPPKANRSEIADVTLSFRFTLIEREALERLAQRRNAQLRGTGATVTATSLGRALVRKELEDSGVYAEVERERAGQPASQASAQAPLLLPGLDDGAREPRRPWGSSASAPAAPLSPAAQPPAAVAHGNAPPPPTPAAPPAAAEVPAAVELPGLAHEASPENGKALNGSGKPAAMAKGKPVKVSAAPAAKGKTKPTRPALKEKSKPAPTKPAHGRR